MSTRPPEALPLAPYRVLQVGSGVALDYCGKLFADFGADVVKLEPAGGDELRHTPPILANGESGLFAWLNTNKRSVTETPAAFASLLPETDVLLDGRPINACLTLVVMQEGAEVTTVEGLAGDGNLHPVQQAFIDHDAFQCGYCTSGQICSAVGLIREGRAKTRDDIRETMSGNICRCGAYPNIVAAIEEAMKAT